MVTLDHARGAVQATAFDHIGIERALHEELCVRDSTRVFLEDAHEELSDRLALGFGLGDSPQLVEEAAPRIDVDEFDSHVALERLDHLRAFVLAHEARVDVHARQLLADRLVHKRCRNGRVDSTGKTADRPLIADLRANGGDLLLDDRRHRPRT